jgi:DNA repair exonuclease SbcCD ATPase subunit
MFSTARIMTSFATKILGADMPQAEVDKIPFELIVTFAEEDCKYAHSIERTKLFDERLLSVESQIQGLNNRILERTKGNPKVLGEAKQSLEQLERSLKSLREQETELQKLYTALKNGVPEWQNKNQAIANKVAGSPAAKTTLDSAHIQMSLKKIFSEIQKLIEDSSNFTKAAEVILKHATQTVENVVAIFPGLASTVAAAKPITANPTSGGPATPAA